MTGGPFTGNSTRDRFPSSHGLQTPLADPAETSQDEKADRDHQGRSGGHDGDRADDEAIRPEQRGTTHGADGPGDVRSPKSARKLTAMDTPPDTVAETPKSTRPSATVWFIARLVPTLTLADSIPAWIMSGLP